MAVIDTDILRVVASLLWTDGNINQNVYNCLVSGGVGPYDDQDVADDMEDWLDNLYLNFTAVCSDEIDGNEVLVYKYDAVGKLKAFENAEGDTFKYEYDDAGRLFLEIDPLGNQTADDYDVIGNITKVKNANGSEYEFKYDTLGRRIEEKDPLGAIQKYK